MESQVDQNSESIIPEILEKHEESLLQDWLQEQANSGLRRDDLMRSSELREQCAEFLNLLKQAARTGGIAHIEGAEWSGVRDLLSQISRTRALQGFSPIETATFVFSFKKPLFDRLREALGSDVTRLADEVWAATQLLDGLGMFTSEAYQRAREEVIARQQQDLLELSTPVVKLWDGVLALPLIGTLDSARTQVVMESLLQMIVDTGAEVAIIDITGVPTVDTLVAQHLLKTVTAARLMGADCIISGIRPQIAQTIVHLGVELNDVITKATLADAFRIALQRNGFAVSRAKTERSREKAG
jgi:rsbT co-antagonist protein RsbR